MDSVVRFSFFIVLSLTLHVVSLPYSFMVPAAPLKSHSVGIDYVSRSLDSFYAPAVNAVSTPPEQPQVNRGEASSSTGGRSVAPIIKPKQIDQLPKTLIVAAEPVPEKIVDKLDPTVANTQLLAEDIPVHEIAHKSLKPTVVKIPFQSEGKVVQASKLMVSPDPIPLTVGQNRGVQRGFKDALPRYNINPPPRYPQVAKLRGWEGKVVFKALILKNGHVGSLQVLASSGYRSLDDAARKAIKRWKFNPATSFGLSIDSQVEIPVTFSLKNM